METIGTTPLTASSPDASPRRNPASITLTTMASTRLANKVMVLAAEMSLQTLVYAGDTQATIAGVTSSPRRALGRTSSPNEHTGDGGRDPQEHIRFQPQHDEDPLPSQSLLYVLCQGLQDADR